MKKIPIHSALASVAYDNDFTSSFDRNINTLGSILLGSYLKPIIICQNCFQNG